MKGILVNWLHFLSAVVSSLPDEAPHYKVATLQVRHFISGTRDYMSPEAYAGLARFLTDLKDLIIQTRIRNLAEPLLALSGH